MFFLYLSKQIEILLFVELLSIEICFYSILFDTTSSNWKFHSNNSTRILFIKLFDNNWLNIRFLLFNSIAQSRYILKFYYSFEFDKNENSNNKRNNSDKLKYCIYWHNKKSNLLQTNERDNNSFVYTFCFKRKKENKNWIVKQDC